MYRVTPIIYFDSACVNATETSLSSWPSTREEPMIRSSNLVEMAAVVTSVSDCIFGSERTAIFLIFGQYAFFLCTCGFLARILTSLATRLQPYLSYLALIFVGLLLPLFAQNGATCLCGRFFRVVYRAEGNNLGIPLVCRAGRRNRARPLDSQTHRDDFPRHARLPSWGGVACSIKLFVFSNLSNGGEKWPGR